MRVAPEQVVCPAVAGFTAPWDSVGSLIVLCHQVIDKEKYSLWHLMEGLRLQEAKT